jgi:rfaE bifunctional protein kinase chain/domain
MIMLTTKSVSELFAGFNKKNVIVIGDVMVDSYLWGNVDRISPEAPVPIVAVDKRENRLGGAANVGLNLKALGATPFLCSVIGEDAKGFEFNKILEEQGLPVKGIVQSGERVTTTKFRVIGNNTQMLRVDEEITSKLNKADRTQLLNRISEIIGQQSIHAIIFQDYDKGVIDKNLITTVVEMAKANKIVVVVDPKKRNFLSFRDVDLFKPNLKELKDGMNIDFDVNNIQEVENAVSQLQKKLNPKMVLNTLSEKGVFIRWAENDSFNSETIDAHIRNIADVSGAGDTVISVAALCLASGVGAADLAAISNLAGGLVCEEVGVVPIDKAKLLEEVRFMSRYEEQ